MAAVVLKPDQAFDGERLYKHLVDFLPSYARPRFVRIMVRQSFPSCIYLLSDIKIVLYNHAKQKVIYKHFQEMKHKRSDIQKTLSQMKQIFDELKVYVALKIHLYLQILDVVHNLTKLNFASKLFSQWILLANGRQRRHTWLLSVDNMCLHIFIYRKYVSTYFHNTFSDGMIHSKLFSQYLFLK